jgi:DNA mismatch repair ATPase MutS
MKAFLMYRDRDFDLQRELPVNEPALTQDLELNTLLNAMARGDNFIFEVARKTVLSSLSDLDTIFYRQDILKDCLKNLSIVKNIYDIAVESIESKKKHWYWFFGSYASPSSILSASVGLMQMVVGFLKKLKNIAEEHSDKFESAGFTTLFSTLNKELTDEYFANVQDHLGKLKFRNGVLMSAELGRGNKGTNYVLRKPQEEKQSWLERIFTSWLERIFARKTPAYTFRISSRDQMGARALGELRSRGINLVANALAQSVDHILNFFNLLRTELAFYVGCLNLHDHLTKKGEPTCFPMPVAAGERRLRFNGLYDVCLSLSLDQRVVGNEINADEKDLVIITGANQGGKSTFLRSLGLAQLMMQCGMFVPAESFCANICDGLFTHYKREEDVTMSSGKLDEELSRMSDIADNVSTNSLLLLNESFAATNEREGSEIARQIISALLEKRIKIFYVTHLYEFAHGFYDQRMANAIFLRAERQADGERTFKIIEAAPLETSYGVDLYNSIFRASGIAH